MSNKTYPISGYAPGNYQCKCVSCGQMFIGDKMAVQCEPCAEAEQNADAEFQNQQENEAKYKNYLDQQYGFYGF